VAEKQSNFIPALPFCHAALTTPKPKPPSYPNALSTLGDHLRKKRLDLRLLQEQVAEQIGVDVTTITNWESNKTAPALRYFPNIIRFLGYSPFPAGDSLPEKPTTARKALGLSRRKLAERLGVNPCTLAGWETGRNKPTRRAVGIIEAFFRTGGT